MQVNGREFCAKGATPAEVQNQMDHFEAIGVRYLVRDLNVDRSDNTLLSSQSS